MSQTIKALFKSTLIPRQTYYGYFRHLCYGKDLTKSSLTASGPDLLLQNLKTAPSAKNVLQIVNEHDKIMNTKHVLQALRSIFDLQKHNCSDVSTKDLLRHPDFDKLCRKLKSQSGIIELNETIEALKVMTYVGVPSKSTIVQVLLQLVKQNINSLNLHHIIFLEFLISNYKSSPLVDALKIALPLVFEINLPIKMDRQNLGHLTEYLQYASNSDLSEKTVETIVQALCQCYEEFDAKTAKSIIWSITDMDSNEFFKPLLEKALNDLIVHLDDLSYQDMETTLSKLISKYTRRYPFYYNEVFFDSCANYIIDHDLGFKHSVYALRKLSRIHYFSKNLLDYLSKKVFEDSSCLEKADSADVYSIAIALSLTDYEPLHWDNLKKNIQDTKNLAEKNRKEIIWLRFASSMCLLEIYKIDVLTRALNIDYLDHVLLKKGYMSDFEHYFAIWQCIKNHKPELQDILPSRFKPENLIKYMKDYSENPLEGALQKGLGGENYVRTNMFSKIGVKIAHTVLFRKGGFPVPINENVKFIEDIALQPGSQLLLIMALQNIHYTINTKTLRRPVTCSIKLLEASGYAVVPINLETWEDLNDFEKIPYLMENIKHKVDNEISISESVV